MMSSVKVDLLSLNSTTAIGKPFPSHCGQQLSQHPIALIVHEDFVFIPGGCHNLQIE